MMFSELYSAYYRTVAQVLQAAANHPLSKGELRAIVAANAFGESLLSIPSALADRWQLIRPDGTSALKHPLTMPLTTLEKRWLKAIYSDPRIRLFTDDTIDFADVEPLFQPEDVVVFDKYADGDPFEDEGYIQNFRLVLDAIRNRYPLCMDVLTRKDTVVRVVLMPEYLEYSEKDDKFRLIGSGYRRGWVINLGRTRSVAPFSKPFRVDHAQKPQTAKETVTFELVNQRNALERALLHFAHFEKQTERLDEQRYRVTVAYDVQDETEMVIRILSFGPMVKVTAPQHFVDLIRERLMKQKRCEG